MQKGARVEVIGDLYGNNAALDVPENIGKQGTIGASPMPGFWWVSLPDGTSIVAAETELKDISATPRDSPGIFPDQDPQDPQRG